MAQEGGFDPLIAHFTRPCPTCAALRARIALLERFMERMNVIGSTWYATADGMRGAITAALSAAKEVT